jgi:Helix-turn-helix domain of transposase family ISL3
LLPAPVALARLVDTLSPTGVRDPVWEPKWDGYRVVCADGRLYSARHQSDASIPRPGPGTGRLVTVRPCDRRGRSGVGYRSGAAGLQRTAGTDDRRPPAAERDRVPVGVFTERHELVPPRAKLTRRAARWATDALTVDDTTVSALARRLGVDWHTCWDAIEVRPRGGWPILPAWTACRSAPASGRYPLVSTNTSCGHLGSGTPTER